MFEIICDVVVCIVFYVVVMLVLCSDVLDVLVGV